MKKLNVTTLLLLGVLLVFSMCSSEIKEKQILSPEQLSIMISEDNNFIEFVEGIHHTKKMIIEGEVDLSQSDDLGDILQTVSNSKSVDAFYENIRNQDFYGSEKYANQSQENLQNITKALENFPQLTELSHQQIAEVIFEAMKIVKEANGLDLSSSYQKMIEG